MNLQPEAKAFLWQLLDTASPSGFEMDGQNCWAAYVRPFADDVSCDAYGNTWATQRGQNPEITVMLEAHADEIGFMIHHISKDGMIYVRRVGGTDHAIARGKRVVFNGDIGPVMGVIGNIAIHIRAKDEKVPQIHELWVDIGAENAEEVAAQGLRIGQVGVYEDGVAALTTSRLIGRALDNRIGGFIIAETLKRLSAIKDKIVPTVHAANCVQEEIGGNGARMLAYRLHPSVALVVDVCHATDTPNVSPLEHGDVRLGKGPTLTHGAANHPKVVKRLMEVAALKGIALQHEAISRATGTDTDDIFIARTGVPSALISLPMRYMHSTIEMIDLRDVEAIIELMVGFVTSIEGDTTFGHTLT